jgi:hypothetical protein
MSSKLVLGFSAILATVSQGYLYAANYQSQRKGQSAHSPQSCLPGGGWEIS